MELSREQYMAQAGLKWDRDRLRDQVTELANAAKSLAHVLKQLASSGEYRVDEPAKNLYESMHTALVQYQDYAEQLFYPHTLKEVK